MEAGNPTLVEWFEFAADRTFTHQDGKRRLSDSALAAWTRHRVVDPRPHFV